MIKKFEQFIKESILDNEFYLEVNCDNLKVLYPDIKVEYNDNLQILISYDKIILELDAKFYEALKKDNIKIEDIVFENCSEISIYNINWFVKISDYGQFGNGIKNFSCSYCNNLKSLEGSPETVNGDFYCFGCSNLESLEGSPETVNGDFYCFGCSNLESLECCPKTVGGNFSCSGCENLKSLQGSPEEINGDFYCSDCNPDFIKLAKEKYGDKVNSINIEL